MASNFDITFDKQKVEFKKKFGTEWNADPQLYLAYIQAIYLASLTEIANNGLGEILTKQNETHQLIQNIGKTLDK